MPPESENRAPKGSRPGFVSNGLFRLISVLTSKRPAKDSHLEGSNPYHGTIMKDPHQLDPGAMDRSKVVSWLHLAGSNPYHGTIMKDPHKLDPGAMDRSKVVSWLH